MPTKNIIKGLILLGLIALGMQIYTSQSIHETHTVENQFDQQLDSQTTAEAEQKNLSPSIERKTASTIQPENSIDFNNRELHSLREGETHNHEDCMRSMKLAQELYDQDETQNLPLEEYIQEEVAASLEDLEEEFQNTVRDLEGNIVLSEDVHQDFEESIAELDSQETLPASDSHM